MTSIDHDNDNACDEYDKKVQIENINAGLFTLALSGGCDDTRGKCSYGEFVVRNIIAIVIIIFIINVIVVLENLGFPFLKINIELLR